MKHLSARIGLGLFTFLFVCTCLSYLGNGVVFAATQGDGQIIYGEGTVATPRNRLFDYPTSTWGAESSLPTNTSTTYATILKASPTRNEMIAGVTNSSGVLNIYRWNGSSWSSEWTVTAGVIVTPQFAITYEESSGDAMVVYSRNVGTTNEMAYRIWNGTSWTSATNLDAVRTSGTVRYITAKTRAGTDEIGIAWADGNRDVSAQFWNGSSWVGEPGTVLENDLGQIDGANAVEGPVIDLAFEELSGRMITVWANNSGTNFKYEIRSNTGTWGAVITPPGFTVQAEVTRLETRPGTNTIAYITSTNWSYDTNGTLYKAEASIWNGTSWITPVSFNTNSIGVVGQSDVGVSWLTSGGTTKALFTYDGVATTGIDYFSYDPSTGFSSTASTSVSPAMANGDDRSHRLVRNPFNASEAIWTGVDANSDLFARKVTFNGTGFTWSSLDPSGASMETSVSSTTLIQGWNADFDFLRYIPPTGTLTSDIVDVAGASVPSPSLNMNAVAAGNSCQTTTGTFGVSAQKIRVTNTTATPGWTLGVAATGGTASNWSSGTANYDFNDGSGGTAGCGDGGDADSIAGQLSVNPSAGTITPQGGCTSTGVSKGSSSAFSQGAIDNITLMSASGSAQTNCYWDLTGVSLSQTIPSFQAPGTYSFNMTMTVAAN
jgi:hypothetical protein